MNACLERVKGYFFNWFQLWHPVSLHDVRRVFWSLSSDSPNSTRLGVCITELYGNLNLGRSPSTGCHQHMTAVASVLRLRSCATTFWVLIPCFCLPTELSLRYLRLLVLMLLPTDSSSQLFVWSESVASAWHPYRLPQLSYCRGSTQTSKICRPQKLS